MRPSIVLSTAAVAPLLHTLALALYSYSPLLPGPVPRSYPAVLFWLAFPVGLVLFQALPFGSLTHRVLLSIAFGIFLWVGVFGLVFLLTCSFGECL